MICPHCHGKRFSVYQKNRLQTKEYMCQLCDGTGEIDSDDINKLKKKLDKKE